MNRIHDNFVPLHLRTHLVHIPLQLSPHFRQNSIQASMASSGMEGASGGAHSYAVNSRPQNHSFHAAKPILAESLAQFCASKAASFPSSSSLQIKITDLGCSHGPNALDCCAFITTTLRSVMRTTARHVEDLEILYNFSDLPSNDFNSLFKHISEASFLCDGERAEGGPRMKVFGAGVPGSFYQRLFQEGTLDVVICVHSLHWLSQVPNEVLDPSSPAWNKGNIWLHPSRPHVVEAFANQSIKDLVMFFECRAKEMASGGILFLFSPTKNHKKLMDFVTYAWMGPLQSTWDELVSEGLIKAEERDAFNVPLYYFDPSEIRLAIDKVSNELEIVQITTIDDCSYFSSHERELLQNNSHLLGKFWARFIASVSNPMLEKHLGKSRAQEFLHRLEKVALQSEPPITSYDNNMVIAIIRRK